MTVHRGLRCEGCASVGLAAGLELGDWAVVWKRPGVPGWYLDMSWSPDEVRGWPMTEHRLVLANAIELAELLIEGLVTRGEIPVGAVATAHIEGVHIELERACVVVEWSKPDEVAS